MKPAHYHALGVSNVIPHIRAFKPTPTMSPLEIAYHRGKEARRLGHPESDNPHTELLVPNDGKLAEQWAKGYGDTSK